MTKEKLEEFRQSLLVEKAKLLAELEQLDQDIRENSFDQYLEGTGKSDVASDVFEQERSFLEQDYLRYHLREVERALERIDIGAYGLSVVSGRPIPLERLEALPWATRLVEEAEPQLVLARLSAK